MLSDLAAAKDSVCPCTLAPCATHAAAAPAITIRTAISIAVALGSTYPPSVQMRILLPSGPNRDGIMAACTANRFCPGKLGLNTLFPTFEELLAALEIGWRSRSEERRVGKECR